MKHLCCSKFLLLLLILACNLFAGLQSKSAVLYYGENISYPMVGIHDYIIVQPSHTNVYTHGFEVYKNKMYAYVSLGEIDRDTPTYNYVDKSWILGENKAWNSDVLDLSNPDYQAFFFSKLIEPQIQRGFKNFFFDTIDSYELVAKTQKQRKKSQEALIHIITTFHTRYPDAKLIINRGFNIIDKVHDALTAVLFESYYRGVHGKKASYYSVDAKNRVWLDAQLQKIQNYGLDIIAVDYLPFQEINTQKAYQLVHTLEAKGFIPYVSTQDLNIYGKSSKEPIKREILTLIDTSQHDKMETGAHLYGALPLEYLGYIQKLYDVDQKLPTLRQMQQYAGVVVWLPRSYSDAAKLVSWLTQVKNAGIKIVFAGSFGIDNINLLHNFHVSTQEYLRPKNNTNSVITSNEIMGFEIQVPRTYSSYYINTSAGEALYKIADSKKHTTTLASYMPWGGFAIGDAFMTTIGDDNLWTINPFQFFQKALNLQKIPVPDPTTENGKRIFFSHIDGDAIMNRVEWNPKLFSGDVIYNEILKKYPLPISVSIVGAEVNDNGLYPKLAPQLQKLVRNIYKLPNIEAATHTFSHPFYWEMIHDGKLSPKYRLKPKGYTFSLDYEIEGMLQQINRKYYPKDKIPKANTLFWSGDCMPQLNALSFVYKHKILNINGGDTYITNLHPWLSYVAPTGLERGEYYQIYTGAQNENVYTNDWHGPYWGFKNAVQTFKLTNSPKRLKPMDIYYHYYSGSKRASLNALKYVYDYALKQEINPIFTSEYIPKAMDYYTISMTQKTNQFLIYGLKDLKTIRIEEKNATVDLINSHNIYGYKHFQNHTYLHVGTDTHILLDTHAVQAKQPYLISANGKIMESRQDINHFHLKLHAHVPVKMKLFIPQECRYTLTKGYTKKQEKGNIISFNYKIKTKVVVDAICK